MEISVGDPFPELRGEYLNGKDAVMPGDANGKVALLLLGFTYKSRFPVEAWTKRFREEFEKKLARHVLRDSHDRWHGSTGKMVHR